MLYASQEARHWKEIFFHLEAETISITDPSHTIFFSSFSERRSSKNRGVVKFKEKGIKQKKTPCVRPLSQIVINEFVYFFFPETYQKHTCLACLRNYIIHQLLGYTQQLLQKRG